LTSVDNSFEIILQNLEFYVEMFIHHEGRYMKCNARERERHKTEIYTESITVGKTL